GSRFQYLADNGPRRDPSCLLRAKILRVLRGSLDADDIPLLEAAAVHYEQVGGAETGAGLREAALLGLDDLDGELAATHAVRLLGETRAAIPPDEASATAVRLLASREMLLPLYLYVLLPGGSPALASECLRHLTSLPAALLPPLIASVAESRNVVVAVGLMDLLVSHEEWREHQDTVLEFLASTADLEAHYYVLTSIVAGHRPELMDEVVAMARIETREERLRNYVAALSLRDYDDAIAEIVADLERRLEGA
ncbi:MAG: hypothetical protein ACK2UL_05145, partial [Anaerolineae bacterium]